MKSRIANHFTWSQVPVVSLLDPLIDVLELRVHVGGLLAQAVLEQQQGEEKLERSSWLFHFDLENKSHFSKKQQRTTTTTTTTTTMTTTSTDGHSMKSAQRVTARL